MREGVERAPPDHPALMFWRQTLEQAEAELKKLKKLGGH